jgi:hypothetical protein
MDDRRVGTQAVAVQRDMGAHRAPMSNKYGPVGGHACVILPYSPISHLPQTLTRASIEIESLTLETQLLILEHGEVCNKG